MADLHVMAIMVAMDLKEALTAVKNGKTTKC
jgi:hypothetical protein